MKTEHSHKQIHGRWDLESGLGVTNRMWQKAIDKFSGILLIEYVIKHIHY